MEANDLAEKCLGHGLYTVGVSQWNKMAIFSKSVNHCKNHRFPPNARQRLDEIQTNVCPHRLRNGQRQQQTRRVQVVRLVALTCGAGADEILDHTAHGWEVEVPAEAMESPLHPFMAVVVRGSHHFEQQW